MKKVKIAVLAIAAALTIGGTYVSAHVRGSQIFFAAANQSVTDPNLTAVTTASSAPGTCNGSDKYCRITTTSSAPTYNVGDAIPLSDIASSTKYN